jgi:hypothetical protein
VLLGVALTRLAVTKTPPERRAPYQLSVISTERDPERRRSADPC